MIKGVRIINFESHQDTEINFAPGLNIIVGSGMGGNVGKSSVLRAIRWCLFCEGGADHISKGKDESSVCVIFEDGWIERVRSKTGSNNYTVCFKDQTPLTYSATGSSVPEDAMHRFELDDIINEDGGVNVFSHRENESAFLLSETASVQRSWISNIFGLSKLNNGIVNAKNAIKQLETEITLLDDNKQTIVKQLEELDSISKYEPLIESWDVTYAKIKDTNYLVSLITGILNMEKQLNMTDKELKKINDHVTHINIICATIQNTLNSFMHVKRSVEILNLNIFNSDIPLRLNDYSNNITEISAYIEQLNQSKLTLCTLKDAMDVAYNSCYKLDQDLINLNKQTEDIKVNIKKLQDTLQICPLCGAEFKGKDTCSHNIVLS
jgi:DNA repair exonuclease SbcCD ATPase subunit